MLASVFLDEETEHLISAVEQLSLQMKTESILQSAGRIPSLQMAPSYRSLPRNEMSDVYQTRLQPLPEESSLLLGPPSIPVKEEIVTGGVPQFLGQPSMPVQEEHEKEGYLPSCIPELDPDLKCQPVNLQSSSGSDDDNDDDNDDDEEGDKFDDISIGGRSLSSLRSSDVSLEKHVSGPVFRVNNIERLTSLIEMTNTDSKVPKSLERSQSDHVLMHLSSLTENSANLPLFGETTVMSASNVRSQRKSPDQVQEQPTEVIAVQESSASSEYAESMLVRVPVPPFNDMGCSLGNGARPKILVLNPESAYPTNLPSFTEHVRSGHTDANSIGQVITWCNLPTFVEEACLSSDEETSTMKLSSIDKAPVANALQDASISLISNHQSSLDGKEVSTLTL